MNEQLAEMYLDNARRQIEELMERVATIRGELAATNMVVHALAAASSEQALVRSLIEQGVKQHEAAVPHAGYEFRNAFNSTIEALLRTLDNRKITKAGE